jgi:hypothetical protein
VAAATIGLLEAQDDLLSRLESELDTQPDFHSDLEALASLIEDAATHLDGTEPGSDARSAAQARLHMLQHARRQADEALQADPHDSSSPGIVIFWMVDRGAMVNLYDLALVNVERYATSRRTANVQIGGQGAGHYTTAQYAYNLQLHISPTDTITVEAYASQGTKKPLMNEQMLWHMFRMHVHTPTSTLQREDGTIVCNLFEMPQAGSDDKRLYLRTWIPATNVAIPPTVRESSTPFRTSSLPCMSPRIHVSETKADVSKDTSPPGHHAQPHMDAQAVSKRSAMAEKLMLAARLCIGGDAVKNALADIDGVTHIGTPSADERALIDTDLFRCGSILKRSPAATTSDGITNAEPGDLLAFDKLGRSRPTLCATTRSELL